jgi:hypothetical protein
MTASSDCKPPSFVTKIEPLFKKTLEYAGPLSPHQSDLDASRPLDDVSCLRGGGCKIPDPLPILTVPSTLNMLYQ